MVGEYTTLDLSLVRSTLVTLLITFPAHTISSAIVGAGAAVTISKEAARVTSMCIYARQHILKRNPEHIQKMSKYS